MRGLSASPQSSWVLLPNTHIPRSLWAIKSPRAPLCTVVLGRKQPTRPIKWMDHNSPLNWDQVSRSYEILYNKGFSQGGWISTIYTHQIYMHIYNMHFRRLKSQEYFLLFHFIPKTQMWLRRMPSHTQAHLRLV